MEGLTLGAALRRTAAKFPDSDAMVFLQAAMRMTWAEFDRKVDRVARGLLALGLRRGDHFGVWSTNWPEWVLLQFATARIGVVMATINPSYRAAELQYTLAQSDVRGLALIERYKSTCYFDLLREVCPEVASAQPGELHAAKAPRLRLVVRMRGSEQPGMMAWDELEKAGEAIDAAALAEAEAQCRPDDPVNLQYTSGTTGLPKGALLSHRNLLLNAFYAAERQRLAASDRICIPVPLYHCFGCVLGTLCAAVSGAAMVFPHEGFDAAATLRAVEAERCTSIYGVPTMFIAELEHADFPQRNTSSLRTGIMAGSPCPIELMKRVVGRDGRPRDHHRLRPDGGFAADHHDQHRRPDREARRHRGSAFSGRRGEDRRSGQRRRTARRQRGRALLPRTRRDAAAITICPRRRPPPSTPAAGCTPAT